MARIGIKQATKDKVIELAIPGVCDLSYPSSLTRRGRVQEGGATRTNHNNNRGYMQDNTNQSKRIKSIGFYDSGTGKHQSNTVYHYRFIVPAITTITGGGTQQIKVLKTWKREL
jgi:hypothetical protein